MTSMVFRHQWHVVNVRRSGAGATLIWSMSTRSPQAARKRPSAIGATWKWTSGGSAPIGAREEADPAEPVGKVMQLPVHVLGASVVAQSGERAQLVRQTGQDSDLLAGLPGID